MAARSIARGILALVIYPGALFGTAGTWRWPEGWVFLALLLGFTLYLLQWLRRHDPALLQERLRGAFRKDQPVWDRTIMAAFVPVWIAWYVTPGLDAVRHGCSHVPLGLEIAGGVAHVLGWLLLVRAHQVNSFLSPAVRLQRERDHVVIDRGPYAVVRHPMYAGLLLWLPGASLLLGSWWALAVGTLAIGLLVVRAALEDRLLQRELPGYAAYAARVRWRMVPGLW